MYNIRYTIVRIEDRNGVNKGEEHYHKVFSLRNITVGERACLDYHTRDKSIITSKVQDIRVWENGLVVTTLNSVYYIEPFISNQG